MAVSLPPRPAAAVYGGHGGHKAGTALETERHIPTVQLPGRWFTFAAWLLLSIAYTLIGYRFTVDGHVVIFDALDRTARSFLVWHNDPPKLAAIGFVFPPLTTMALLPFALIKPIATSLIAIPVSSAVFAAGTVVMLDRVCARCDMNPILRLPLVALFAVNPFWIFYAGNGMSEAAYAFFLAFSLYSFVSWYTTTEPRYLIAAGFSLAVLGLVRYAFIIWAALFALLIGIALIRRRASMIEVEGSVVAFASPIAYVLALWILFNWLIIGHPLDWLNDATTSTQAVNSTGINDLGSLSFNDVARRMLELNAAIFPLAFAVVPALVIVFISQRNDMALWLASFIVLGIVIIGVHAYTAEKEGLLTLRDSMPMYVAAFVGAAWLFRSLPEARVAVFGLTGVLLIVNLFTAWHGMKTYPFQNLEQAFTHTLFSGDDQEGRPSIGGFTVGVAPEARMADELKSLPQQKNSVLSDNAQTFGTILLYGRPQNVFDRIDKGDEKFRSVMGNPWGKVAYMLVATGRNSPDLIARRYPGISENRIAGLTPIFRTSRYALIRVAKANPRRRARRRATTTPSTATTTTTTTTTP